MKDLYDSGDLGRIYYMFAPINVGWGGQGTAGYWWNRENECYESYDWYAYEEGRFEGETRHISQLMGKPIHCRFRQVTKMPDRIPASGEDCGYSAFYSDRFLLGLAEIGIQVPYQEVVYGSPLDPLTAEERVRLGRRYFALKFEETTVRYVRSIPHASHYYGEADLFVTDGVHEAVTHPVMEMVHRKRLTGFDGKRRAIELRRHDPPQMPPCPCSIHDKDGCRRWKDELERKTAAFRALPDPTFKDRSWPGERIEYLLANGYRL